MMTLRALFAALFLAILAIGVQAQFSNVAVSGAAPERSSAIKEALADSIRLRAEAHKEKVLAKHGQEAQASQADVAAKTKSFAYTKIHIPGSR